MTISAHSSVTAAPPQPAQSSAPASKTSFQPEDSVQLSAAAQSHLKSGDADKDGDSH